MTPDATPRLDDHPQRYALSNELHARPAPRFAAPATVAFMAIKSPGEDGAPQDRAAIRAHLITLLERYGVAHPAPEATHHACELGRSRVKWESHTEFTSWMVQSQPRREGPFAPAAFDVFPDDWLASTPGTRLTSVILNVEVMPMKRGQPDEAAISAQLDGWFVGESLAVAAILDGAAIVASDFRIDPAGHVRMAVFAHPETGQRRVGRIVQRLCEIEMYKSASMLGLDTARRLGRDLSAVEQPLGELVTGMAERREDTEGELRALMSISARLEQLEAQTAFRFGATRAYEAIVHDRIDVLRESRFGGRQTLTEFMRRRYDPAMRTARAAQTRLAGLSERAMRAGRLLSTQVEVARSAQNQAVLKSMDERAELQLRLQHTVEGLSVVAISYYAVGLLANVVTPFAYPLGLEKPGVMAALTPLVVLGVWFALRQIRKRLH